jgi:hypothetical protein
MNMILEQENRLADPDLELQRAQSNYLNLSKHYSNYSTDDYIEEEEAAWNRLEDALRALGKIKPFALDKSEPSV